MNSEEEIENVTLIEMERRGVKTKRQYLWHIREENTFSLFFKVRAILCSVLSWDKFEGVREYYVHGSEILDMAEVTHLLPVSLIFIMFQLKS
jgi:hypothetical protein